MSESLPLEERVRVAIATGESYFREFKSALAGPPGNKAPRKLADVMTDIGRTLVAFANADGGELLIGVEDDGQVTGVPFSGAEIDQLFEASVTHVHAGTPLPSPRKSIVNLSGHIVLYFHVPKGTDYVYLTSDGRCIRRVDRESVPVTAESISTARLEDQSRKYDRLYSWPTATVADLDLDLVGSVAAQVAYGISPEKCLQYLDLAEFGPNGLQLKNAALILFAKNVQRWHARCQVRITSYEGSEATPGRDFVILKDDVIVGNILDLTETAWERLQVAISQRTALSEQARFEQTYLYPQVACREALINAIVHRDYSAEGRGIEVSLFSDRMEIVSPGQLLSTVSVEELQELEGAHESRNPLVARVLREVGLVREMGEGIRRIFEVMRSNALATPQLVNEANTFKVALFNRSMYEGAVQLWLSNFDELHPNEQQRAVIALGYNGRTFSTQDIIDRLGLVDVDLVRVVITPLRQAGVLDRVLNDAQMMRESRKRSLPKRQIPAYRVLSPSQLNEVSRSGNQSDDSGDLAGVPSPHVPYRPPKVSEIFLGNLANEVSVEEVTELLGRYGEVEAVAFPGPKSQTRNNNGYSFARVALSRPLEEVLHELAGTKLRGRPLVAQMPRGRGA